MPRLACLVVYFSISYATLAISSENFVDFDGASASSSYSQEAFAARQALNAGSGYWCRCVRSNGFWFIARRRVSKRFFAYLANRMIEVCPPSSANLCTGGCMHIRVRFLLGLVSAAPAITTLRKA